MLCTWLHTLPDIAEELSGFYVKSNHVCVYNERPKKNPQSYDILYSSWMANVFCFKDNNIKIPRAA